MFSPGTSCRKSGRESFLLTRLQFLRWQLITAFDVVTECILILLSIVIVLPVQIAFVLKCQVVLAFAFRLP